MTVSYHARYYETKPNPSVVVFRREWYFQGDKPDYYDLIRLSASEARRLARELLVAAERIDKKGEEEALKRYIENIAQDAKRDAMG